MGKTQWHKLSNSASGKIEDDNKSVKNRSRLQILIEENKIINPAYLRWYKIGATILPVKVKITWCELNQASDHVHKQLVIWGLVKDFNLQHH